MFTNRTIKKFHLVQTSGQLIILLICGVLSLINVRLLKQSQIIRLLICIILSFLEFLLLKPENEQPQKWQMVNHYLSVIALCYTLPKSLFFLTQVLNHYHLINMTFWMILITLYSFILYIPMTKLALVRIKNNWGRIMVFAWVIYNTVIWTPSHVAGNLHYTKILMQMNDSGFSGILVLIIITLIIMPKWKIKRPHFTFSLHASLWFSSLIILLLVAHLFYIIWPTIINAYSLDVALNYYLEQINLGIVFNAIRTGIAEEWIMRFIIIALLAQVFHHNKYRIYLIVLTDALLFGTWHLTNIYYQSFLATLRQMIEIGSWGLVLAAVYLYTHSLLLTMTYHGLYDFILFLLQGGIAESGNIVKNTFQPTAYDWQLTFIRMAIYTFIALIIISGKHNHKTIKDNLVNM